MSTDDPPQAGLGGAVPPPIDGQLSTDEQLGSPVLSFEEGWLVGIALGSLMIFALARRRGRRRSAAV